MFLKTAALQNTVNINIVLDRLELGKGRMAEGEGNNDKKYELLLHALSHEHTSANNERHLLLFEKWCRDFSGGIYIRDLKFVIPFLSILRDRVLSDPALFTPALSKVLKVLSKPLLESRANERLRTVGIDSIKLFFLELAKFFDGSIFAKKEVAKCFRCIINAGVDPTILKADAVEWVSDGTQAQIVDINFIQSLFRESSAITIIIEQFRWSVEMFVYQSGQHRQQSDGGAKIVTSIANSGLNLDDDDSDDERTPSMGSDNVNSRSNRSAGDENQSPLGSPSSGSPRPLNEGPLTEATVDSTASINIATMLEYSQIMLDLCLDLAKNSTSAAAMCTAQISDPTICLLGESAYVNGPRDRRVAATVELLWTCMESYFAQEEEDPVEYSFESLISKEVVNFETAIETLKNLLLQLLADGYRLADKEVRNEVLVVLSLLARFPSAFPAFIQSRLFTVLVTYGCVGEVGRRAWPFLSTPLAKFRNFASVFDVDLQFKRELWMLIGDLLHSDDPDALLCVASSPLIPYMMSFLEQNSFDKDQPKQHTDAPPKTPSRNESFDGSERVDITAALISATGGAHHTGSVHSVPSVNGDLEHFELSGDGLIANRRQGTLTQLDIDSKASPTYLAAIPLTELRELQVLCMVFLAENAHKMMSEFLRIFGPTKALDIIFMYCRSPLLEHKNLVYHALLLLNRCITTSNTAKKILELENAIEIWLYVFEHSDDDATRAVAARLIAIVCTNNLSCQTQFRRLRGIELLISTLSKYSEVHQPTVGRKAGIKLGIHSDNELENPLAAGTGGDNISTLIVSILDCLGRGIVGNFKNEMKLAQSEGIDAILDLLETSDFILRVQVIRLLADVIENQKLLSFLNAWRSAKTMRSAAQIVCHCYMDEEARLDCKRENGVINNLWKPLGNHSWPRDINDIPVTLLEGSSVAVSSTVLRLTNAIHASRYVPVNGLTDRIRHKVMEQDTRGILVSILSRMGLLQDAPVLPVAPRTPGSPSFGDSPKRLSTTLLMAVSSNSDEQSGITPVEKQVISIAKKYHVLKEGIWWLSVSQKLKEEGLIPIDADIQMLEAHLSEYFEAARIVHFEQMELYAVNQQERQAKEDLFLGSIISKKNSYIKSEWLKKNSKASGKNTFSKHTTGK